jgi:tubulin alpha
MHGTASVCLFHRVAWSPLIILVLDYKFDLMYSKRAFVHWYVGEGMEEVRPYPLVLFACAF